MKRRQHGLALIGLVAFAAALYIGLSRRAEVTSAAALPAVEAARAAVRPGLHLHVLAIVAAHRVACDEGPAGWERAAQLVAIAAAVGLAVPAYLVALEIFEASTAWLGTALFLASPLMAELVANVLAGSLFLFFWAWGLWAAIRFLREGRWPWLLLFTVATACAASLRPEGAWLAVSFWVVVAIMPWSWAAPVARSATWPVFLIISVLATAALVHGLRTADAARGPDVAIAARPGLTDSPAVAEATARAVVRALKITRNAVGLRLLPLAVLGVLLAWSGAAQARIWLLLGLLLAGDLTLLVARRAVLGECAVRDALGPSLLLTLAAGHGLGWLARRAQLEAARLGGVLATCRPGPILWLGALGLLFVAPTVQALTADAPRGGFAPYRTAAAWLRAQGAARGTTLDLTGWTSFGLPDDHGSRPARWLVVRQGQIRSRSPEQSALVAAVGDAVPAARFPVGRHGKGLQVWIYDLSQRQAPVANSVGENPPAIADLRLILDERASNVKQ